MPHLIRFGILTFFRMPLHDERLPGRQTDRHFRTPFKECIDGEPRSVAGFESVVVEQNKPSPDNPVKAFLQSIEDAFTNIEIYMQECNSVESRICETVRNETRVKLGKGPIADIASHPFEGGI